MRSSAASTESRPEQLRTLRSPKAKPPRSQRTVRHKMNFEFQSILSGRVSLHSALAAFFKSPCPFGLRRHRVDTSFVDSEALQTSAVRSIVNQDLPRSAVAMYTKLPRWNAASCPWRGDPSSRPGFPSAQPCTPNPCHGVASHLSAPASRPPVVRLVGVYRSGASRRRRAP